MKEVIVAARIEREFEKREILQLYLNKVYFGDGLYGAEAASLGYFGKPAAELTLSEAGAARRAGQIALDATRRLSISTARSHGARWCCRRCATPRVIDSEDLRIGGEARR